MEKEISNGAMLGIVLIALAAIIGLGFGVFAIAKGTANEGVTNVQENLGAVGNAAFTDYDQKIVTGTQVLSAYQNFEGKPYAVVIATKAVKDKITTLTSAAGMETYGNAGVGAPTVKDGDAGITFINYNALLGGTNMTKPDSSNIATPAGKIVFDSNCFRANNGFLVTDGKVQFNNISGNMSKSGMVEYVPSGARFQAYLIKDDSGTIMGIAFEQI